MALHMSLSVAAIACSASLLTPTVAFVTHQHFPFQASPTFLFREDGTPYSGGSKKSSLVNSTTNGEQELQPTAINGDADISATIPNDEVDVVGAGTLGDIMAGSGNKDDITQQPTPTTIIDGLVTKEGGELNARFPGCDFSPMERIALTANGNLQRIFSSYYDAPVHVHVDSCSRRNTNKQSSQKNTNNDGSIGYDSIQYAAEMNGSNDDDDAIWDRVVHIQVHNQTICKATSIIRVQSPLCIELIENGSVGLGQMFRYLNKLPTFSLLDAGRRRAIIDDDEGSKKLSLNVEDEEFRGGMWRTYELQCEEMTCLIHEEFHRDAWNII